MRDMNTLKSVLAALFVGELGYVIGIVLAVAKYVGIRRNAAIGVRVWIDIATSWVALSTALVGFVLALWLFQRRSAVP